VSDIVTVRDLDPLPQLEFTLFPNPAADVLNVQMTLPQAGNTMLELLDERGRVVQRKLLGRRPAGLLTEQLSVVALPGGMYYVRVVTENANYKGAVKLVIIQ
jgi:hypothetical protein